MTVIITDKQTTTRMGLIMFGLILIAVAMELCGVSGRPEGLNQHASVVVNFWPRSQWDPEQSFAPARVIVTRAIKICQELDDTTGLCSRTRDAWSTVLCRKEKWGGYVEEAKKSHRLPHPHIFELYHTYDNVTYDEVPLWSHEKQEFVAHFESGGGGEKDLKSEQQQPFYLEETDRELLLAAKNIAMENEKNRVIRWDYGHYWLIPRHFQTIGERALSTGIGIQTKVQEIDPELLDFRPTYIPPSLLYSMKKRSSEKEEEKNYVHESPLKNFVPFKKQDTKTVNDIQKKEEK